MLGRWWKRLTSWFSWKTYLAFSDHVVIEENGVTLYSGTRADVPLVLRPKLAEAEAQLAEARAMLDRHFKNHF
jgi:hypothetical protein